jgi:hypothetical protein
MRGTLTDPFTEFHSAARDIVLYAEQATAVTRFTRYRLNLSFVAPGFYVTSSAFEPSGFFKTGIPFNCGSTP